MKFCFLNKDYSAILPQVLGRSSPTKLRKYFHIEEGDLLKKKPFELLKEICENSETHREHLSLFSLCFLSNKKTSNKTIRKSDNKNVPFLFFSNCYCCYIIFIIYRNVLFQSMAEDESSWNQKFISTSRQKVLHFLIDSYAVGFQHYVRCRYGRSEAILFFFLGCIRSVDWASEKLSHVLVNLWNS